MTHWLLYIERLSRYSVFLVKCSLRLIYAVHGYHEILLFAAPRILLPRSSASFEPVQRIDSPRASNWSRTRIEFEWR